VGFGEQGSDSFGGGAGIDEVVDDEEAGAVAGGGGALGGDGRAADLAKPAGVAVKVK